MRLAATVVLPFRERPFRVANPVNASGVDLVAVLHRRSISVAPAQDVESPVRTDFDIGGFEHLPRTARQSAASFSVGEDAGKTTFALQQRSVPLRLEGVDLATHPVIHKKDVSVLIRKLGRVIMNHARARAFKQRSARGHAGQVPFAGPVIAPGVSPAEMGSVKRGEDLVALTLIVVRAKPVEAVVEGDIPGIAKAPRHNFQIAAIVAVSVDWVAAKNAARLPPVIVGRVIIAVVAGFVGDFVWCVVRGSVRRRQTPQLSKRLWGELIQPVVATRVSFRHIQLAVRAEVQSVQRVLQVSKTGIDANVLVGFVVTVSVADDRQVGSIGYPQVTAFPGQPLNRIEAFGKCLAPVRDPITIVINKDVDTVTGSVRKRSPPLLSLTNKDASQPVECHHAGIPDHRLLRYDINNKTVGNDRQVFFRSDCHGAAEESNQECRHQPHRVPLNSRATDIPSSSHGWSETDTGGDSGWSSRQIICSTA